MPWDSATIRLSVDPETLENFQESVRAWTARWADRIEAEAISRRPARLMPVSDADWHRVYLERDPTYDYTIRTADRTGRWTDIPPQPTPDRSRPRPRPYVEPLQKGEHMLQLSPTLQSIVYDAGYDNRICALLAYDRYRLSTERMNYLDVDGDRLTYMPANRVQEEYPDGTWKPTGRQSGRPAKIIRSLMSDDVKGQFSDKDFEVFANIVKSYDARSRGTFDLVEGTDIVTLYNEDAYMDECGSMAASCMRYEGCEDYFGIYAENPAIIKMLVLRDNKRKRKIHGRALVWFVPGFETPIMDRVYGNDHTLQAFRAYAVEQGWYYRAYNTYSYEQYFIKDGESVRLKIRVALPSFRYDLYPYMDTMKFFDSKTGEFSNYETSSWCSYLSDIHGHEDIPHRWYNHPDGYKKAFSQVEIVASNPVQKRTQERAYILDPLPDEEPLPFAETLSEDDYDLWLAESRLHRLEEVLLEP